MNRLYERTEKEAFLLAELLTDACQMILAGMPPMIEEDALALRYYANVPDELVHTVDANQLHLLQVV